MNSVHNSFFIRVLYSIDISAFSQPVFIFPKYQYITMLLCIYNYGVFTLLKGGANYFACQVNKIMDGASVTFMLSLAVVDCM